MKLNVPYRNQRMELAADCTICITYRSSGGNLHLLNKSGHIKRNNRGNYILTANDLIYDLSEHKKMLFDITFMKGTILEIKKMYIRDGDPSMDYILVKIVKTPNMELLGHPGTIAIMLSELSKLDVV